MKYILFALTLFTLASCSSSKTVFTVPGQQIIETDLPNFDAYTANIKNVSLRGVSIAVVDKSSQKQIRGFGLGPKGDAKVTVEASSKLVIINDNPQSVKVKVGFEETSPAVLAPPPGGYINFTLRNNTGKSIPLIIPNVMNPNLSPTSNSGVNLERGQEIFFKKKGKKHLLLVVDDNIKDGDVLDVNKLIEERMKELGL